MIRKDVPTAMLAHPLFVSIAPPAGSLDGKRCADDVGFGSSKFCTKRFSRVRPLVPSFFFSTFHHGKSKLETPPSSFANHHCGPRKVTDICFLMQRI